jgi:uncharacterized protein YbjQ (UPF0145 family)
VENARELQSTDTDRKVGELRGMTKVPVSSRNEVMGRMMGEAQARGANAIIAMRFDTSEMGNVWTEICAYGTAVRISSPAQ